MYLFLIDDTNEQKKAKDVNKNGAARIDHGEYKNVLLNKKCLRYSINRIKLNIKLKIIEQELMKLAKLQQNFDDKICILNNGFDGLTLGCQS